MNRHRASWARTALRVEAAGDRPGLPERPTPPLNVTRFRPATGSFPVDAGGIRGRAARPPPAPASPAGEIR